MMLYPPTSESGYQPKHRPPYGSFEAYPSFNRHHGVQAFFNIDGPVYNAADRFRAPGMPPELAKSLNDLDLIITEEQTSSSPSTSGSASPQVGDQPHASQPIQQLRAEMQQHAITVTRTLDAMIAEQTALRSMVELIATRVVEGPVHSTAFTTPHRASGLTCEHVDIRPQVGVPAGHTHHTKYDPPTPNVQPSATSQKRPGLTCELFDNLIRGHGNGTTNTYSRDDATRVHSTTSSHRHSYSDYPRQVKVVNNTRSKNHRHTLKGCPRTASYGYPGGPSRESPFDSHPKRTSGGTAQSKNDSQRTYLAGMSYKYAGTNGELLDIRPKGKTGTAHSKSRRHSSIITASSSVGNPIPNLTSPTYEGDEEPVSFNALLDVGTKRRPKRLS